MRRNQPLQTPTFAQTVVIVREVLTRYHDVQMTATDMAEQSIQRHLALGFHYDKEQIYRALKAIIDPARRWSRRNRASASSRTSTRRSA